MQPDFGRDVHCVLGLPFDAVSESQAEALLRSAAAQRKRCFLSTPNLNFAVQCISDAAFRDSVLQSDLNVADGWPIVMVGRWSGVPLPGRVAGSTLFERLHQRVGRPLSVYFFGGPEGAAEAACRRVNAVAGGLSCVGHASPGFGSVEALSSAEQLAHINGSQADFVVVALGAKKGQAWIQRNLAHLQAPLISHLGAVVNFEAGTVRRAPPWAQKLRLEWLWRIREEPALWRRYAGDALSFGRLLITRVAPLVWQMGKVPSPATLNQAQVHVTRNSNGNVLHLSGAWAHPMLGPLRQHLQTLAGEKHAIALDLSAVNHIDNATIALLCLMYGWQRQRGLGWSITATSPVVKRTLKWACADYLLQGTASAPAT